MLFAPEGCYTDIAFGITRRGRDQVREHHRIWRTAVPEFAMLREHAYESGSTVIVKTVCYGTFSGADLGGGKLKATFRSFRARAISVLELNEQSQILACTEYYDKSTMPIGDATPFNHLAWPYQDLAEALSTKMVTAS